MKKIILLAAALIILIPAVARPDTMTFRIGYYTPNATTDSWLAGHPNSLLGIEFYNMTFPPSDFRGAIMGGGYEWFLTPQFSLALSVDFFSRENGGYYRDYVGIALDNTDFQGDYAFPAQYYYGDFEVLHTLHISMTPIQLSLKVAPLGRKHRIIPYFGGGGGLYFLHAHIYGSIVDFSQGALVSDPEVPEAGEFYIYPLAYADLHETQAVFGAHAFGGLMFPIGYRMTLEAEGRYHWASANFNGAFPASEFGKFDMSGWSISLGFNYWF